METQTKPTSREEWRKRVERWKDSGLSAEEFSAEHGINAGTLKYWKYRLGKDERSKDKESKGTRSKPLPLVEVRPSVAQTATWFELELSTGQWLRIPDKFNAITLERLLHLLERKR